MVTDRSRPRLWHHDYLHLRPLARDLEARIAAATRLRRLSRVLDLGCGASPYRRHFGDRVEHYVRLDLDAAAGPDVIGSAEALPFVDGVFDVVLSTQVFLYVDACRAVAEIEHALRGEGRVLVSCHGAWPEVSSRPVHRFGEPDLRQIFARLEVTEVVAEGGMLGLPFSLANVAAREAVRAAERRLGAAARVLRAPAAVFFLINNLIGRALEWLAGRGPLRPFLGALDRSLPVNYLVVAVKKA